MPRDRGRTGTGGRMPRRGTDRVEDATAWLVMSAGLVLIFVAGVAGLGVHAHEAERARSASATVTEVVAVLVEDAPDRGGDYVASSFPVRAPARWTGPDGTPRTGRVLAPAAATAGTEVTVWVDREGHVARAPVHPVNAVLAGLGAAVGMLSVGVMGLVGVWVAVRRVTAARNARAWEREWLSVGPEWSSGTGAEQG